MTIFPATAVTDVVTEFSSVVGANIVPVLGMFGTFLAVGWITRRGHKASRGKL